MAKIFTSSYKFLCQWRVIKKIFVESFQDLEIRKVFHYHAASLVILFNFMEVSMKICFLSIKKALEIFIKITSKPQNFEELKK